MDSKLALLTVFFIIGCATQSRERILTKHFNDKNFPKQFSRVLTAYSNQALERCYQPYLRRFDTNSRVKPKKGLLEYKIVFNQLGKVNKVQLNKKSPLPKSVEKCVRAGLWKVNFGKSKFTSFTAFYPVEYTYKKKPL